MNIEYHSYMNVSGISSAAKNYISILDKLGHNVHVKPFGPLMLDSRSRLDSEIKTIIEKHNNEYKDPNSFKPDIRIIQAVPPVGLDILKIKDDIPSIFMYAWEGIHLPCEFKEAIELADHCITFCKLQYNVYKNDIGDDNISWIPHVVLNRHKFNKNTKQKKYNQKGYVFLSVFEWNERKDPTSLLKAFLHEFEHSENANLVMKIMGANEDQVKKQIEKIQDGMRLVKVPPNIVPVFTYLSDSDLMKLYKEADCYVNTARGEGFGIPLIESLFLGTPIIYPEKYVDTLPFNKDNSLSVKSYDTFMYASKYIQNRGDNIWGNISDVDLASKMRYMYENSRTKFQNPVYPTDEFIEAYNNMGDNLVNIISDTINKGKKKKDAMQN